MKKLKLYAKKLIKKGMDYQYHKFFNLQAAKILKNIEKEKGKTNPRFVRLAKEYAIDVLGNEKYSPWLLVYSATAGKFKEGWIPPNFYGKEVVPRLIGEYGKISDRNPLTHRLLKPKSSLDTCYYVNNLFWTTDYQVVNEQQVKELLFENNERVVFKKENTLQGTGIHFFTKENFKIRTIKEIGNGIFQSYIQQHSFFSNFTRLSVATIRITSVSDDDGNILIKSVYLRLGKKDDTHVKSSSAIKVPVNIKNGDLYECGYFPDWTMTKKHPDNKITFLGKTIPQFTNCISEAIRMHRLIPFVRAVGWDITIDNSNQICLIEWNGGHNDIRFSEATQGPCFKEFAWEKLRYYNHNSFYSSALGKVRL